MFQTPVGAGGVGKGPQHWPARPTGRAAGADDGGQPTVQLHEGRSGSSDLAPPTWTGEQPEKHLRFYLKAAEAWNRVTKVPPTQRGLSLMAASTGRLREVLGTMELDYLTDDQSFAKVIDKVKEEYADILEKQLPILFEELMYSNEAVRRRGEAIPTYINRKRSMMAALSATGCELPTQAKGLLLLKGAQLSKAETDAMTTWLQGSFGEAEVTEALRKLSRPTSLSGMAAGAASPHVLNVLHDDWQSDWQNPSLMDSWESWDAEWHPGYGDPWETGGEYGDFDGEQDVYVDELASGAHEGLTDEDASILATYTQARAALRQSQLSRGYHKGNIGIKGKQKKNGLPWTKGSMPSKGWTNNKGYGKNKMQQGRGQRLEALIQRTHCLTCGQLGHWARECPLREDKGKSPYRPKGKHVTFTSTGETESGEHYPAESVGLEPYAELFIGMMTEEEKGTEQQQALNIHQASNPVGRCLCILGLIAGLCLGALTYMKLLPSCYLHQEPVILAVSSMSTVSSTTVPSSQMTLANLPSQYGLLDTGAQLAVIGEAELKKLTVFLSGQGLQPVWIASSSSIAKGVGGATTIVGTCKLPVAIGGVCGTLKVAVVKQPLPLLLPVTLCSALQMHLCMDKCPMVHWQALGRSSPVSVLLSGHLAVEVFAFPKKGWHKSKSSRLFHVYHTAVLEQDPASSPPVAPLSSKWVHVGSQSSPSVGQTSESQEPMQWWSIFTAGTAGMAAMGGCGWQGVASDLPCQGCQVCPEEVASGYPPGNPPKHSWSNAQHAQHSSSLDGHLEEAATFQDRRQQRAACRIASQPRQSGKSSQERLRASRPCAQVQGQQDNHMVHLHPVRKQMADSTPCSQRSTFRGALTRRKVQEHCLSPHSPRLCSMGSQGVRGAWGHHARESSSVCTMDPQKGARAGDRGHESSWQDRSSWAGKGQVRNPSPNRGGAREFGIAGANHSHDNRLDQRRRGHVAQPMTNGIQPLSYQLDTSALHDLLEDLRLPSQHRQKSVASHGVGLGLYTRQGLGITSATYKHPRLLKEILRLAPVGFPFLAIQINELQVGEKITVHRDFNFPDSSNAVLVLGDYDGGHLWLETGQAGRPPPKAVISEEKHETYHGEAIGLPGSIWWQFDASMHHAILPVTRGCRWSVVLYLPKGLERVPQAVWLRLKELHFPSWKLMKKQPEMWSGVLDLPGHPADGLHCFWHQGPIISSSFAQNFKFEVYHVTGKHVIFDGNLEIPDDEVITIYVCKDGFFPYCELELKTMPRKVRQFLVKQLPSKLEIGMDFPPQDHEAVVLPTQVENVDAAEDESSSEQEQEAEPHRVPFSPSQQEAQSLQHIHNHIGHPAKPDFVRLLRRSGARKEVWCWVRDHFVCPHCEATKPPPARQPSSTPTTFVFNQLTGLDVFDLTCPVTGTMLRFLNICCWGTQFSAVAKLDSLNAVHVWERFMMVWGQCFGLPRTMVVDQGSEFRGYFSIACGMHGCTLAVCNVESPWENSRTERAGGTIKRISELMFQQVAPSSMHETISCVYAACQAKNRHTDVSGFSATQRVLGLTPPIPGVLTGQGTSDNMIALGPLESMRQAQHLRELASECFMKEASRSRLKRAALARNRKPPSALVKGDRVYVFRRTTRARSQGWYGPGTVVAPTPSGAFVNMAGSVWKVSRLACRLQTTEESFATVQVERHLHSLRRRLLEGGQAQRRYLDVSHEVPPTIGEEKEPHHDETPSAEAEFPEHVQQEEHQQIERAREDPEASHSQAAEEKMR